MTPRGGSVARALTPDLPGGADPADPVPLRTVGEPRTGIRAHEGTRTHLLERGRQHVREHGRPPTLREFRYWRKRIIDNFGSFPEYIVALGFIPANNAGVRVPAAPIVEAVFEAVGRQTGGGADPEAGMKTILGIDLARQVRRIRQQGFCIERVADEILCRIGRTDLWHTDPRLWGVGCVTTSGEALLSDETGGN